MFQLIQSNSMHRLVDVFIDRARETAPGPFRAQTVVVQSFGMGQWLKIRQAEALGISANTDCLLPANLVWRLYQVLLPELELPTESPFSIERVTWHLMKIMPQIQGEEFAPVRDFLGGPGDRQVRGWQLGEKVATLFDQYLIYRPDWITAWERRNGGPDSWQGALWRALLAEDALAGRAHRAHLHATLMDRLADAGPLPPGLPDHLSVVGLSTLPPIHLEVLQALSRHIDVDLYFLNPCQHYWGDVFSEKEVARRSVKSFLGKAALGDTDYLEVGNPLLSSWGKQGREYFELLLETPTVESSEFFEDPGEATLLRQIKQDILDMTFGGEFESGTWPAEPHAVADDDISVQVHVCHSRMREVEVLYDQLLRLVDEAGVTPADIIVMMPDVADYAPFIEAVFRRDRLPFAIADRSLTEESPVLLALRTLLALPESRMKSTEIMDLLEVPTIARRFDLDEDDLVLIGRWIRDAGIRWELDERARSERWQLAPVRENTWRFGLDRLLLGYAMSSEDGIFDGILPFDVDSGDAVLLGKLCDVVDLLADYRDALSESRTPVEWRRLVIRLMEDFLAPRGQEELDLASVRDLLIRLESETFDTGYEEPLSSRMFRYWLEQQLSIDRQSRGFISGGVTFATLVPMRSIPFRVVCVLGMNDGEYPREDRPPTFDLMTREGWRKGDRSKRNDDRYLFLEALLSADDHFYVSYEGRSVKDNKERPPSVLVSELLEYLDRAFQHDVVTTHPLQPFSEEYYRPGGLITYRQEWFDALREPHGPIDFIGTPLPDDPEMALESLDQLRQFFSYPARTFLRNRLKVYFDDDEVELDEAESFELDGLDQYQLTQFALTRLGRGESEARVRTEAVASGTVMAGDIGDRHMSDAIKQATLVLEALAELSPGEPEPFHGRCELAGVHLEGTLNQLYPSGLIAWQASRFRKRQLLARWVEHLFANAVRGPTASTVLALGTHRDAIETHRLEALPAQEAADTLTTLATLYRQGMNAPLKFLPELSHVFAAARLDGESATQAMERAMAEWERDQPGGENMDANYVRLFSFPGDFDDDFERIALTIYEPLRARWSSE